MNKKCIYTYIIGDYDTLAEPKHVSLGWDYICVTDNDDIVSDVWKIIKPCKEHMDIMISKRRSTMCKIEYFKYVNDYDTVIIIDGNVEININLDEFINKYKFNKQYDIALLKHPQRRCIYQEARTVITLKKDNKEHVEHHVDYLKSNNMPSLYGLCETCVMIINNNNKTYQLFTKWAKDYMSLPSIRDQLTLTFTLYKFKEEHNDIQILQLPIKDVLIKSKDINLTRHKSKIKK
jgi:hypothetical protein